MDAIQFGGNLSTVSCYIIFSYSLVNNDLWLPVHMHYFAPESFQCVSPYVDVDPRVRMLLLNGRGVLRKPVFHYDNYICPQIRLQILYNPTNILR